MIHIPFLKEIWGIYQLSSFCGILFPAMVFKLREEVLLHSAVAKNNE